MQLPSCCLLAEYPVPLPPPAVALPKQVVGKLHHPANHRREEERPGHRRNPKKTREKEGPEKVRREADPVVSEVEPHPRVNLGEREVGSRRADCKKGRGAKHALAWPCRIEIFRSAVQCFRDDDRGAGNEDARQRRGIDGEIKIERVARRPVDRANAAHVDEAGVALIEVQDGGHRKQCIFGSEGNKAQDRRQREDEPPDH